MTDIKLPDFLIVPSILVLDRDLRPTDHLIYAVVYWYSRLKLEKCILSNQGFSVLLNISESAVQYGLRRMSQKGYIDVVFEDAKKTKRKEIIPLVVYDTTTILEVDKYPSPHHQMSTPPRTNVHQNNIDLIREFNNTNTYSQILEHWNSKKIVTHRVLTEKTKRSINGRLRDKYTLDEILRSIDNYDLILKGNEYFFNYKWTLHNFLQRGFEKFLDLEIAKQNYKKGGYQNGYENPNRAKEGKYDNIEYEG